MLSLVLPRTLDITDPEVGPNDIIAWAYTWSALSDRAFPPSWERERSFDDRATRLLRYAQETREILAHIDPPLDEQDKWCTAIAVQMMERCALDPTCVTILDLAVVIGGAIANERRRVRKLGRLVYPQLYARNLRMLARELRMRVDRGLSWDTSSGAVAPVGWAS